MTPNLSKPVIQEAVLKNGDEGGCELKAVTRSAEEVLVGVTGGGSRLEEKNWDLFRWATRVCGWRHGYRVRNRSSLTLVTLAADRRSRILQGTGTDVKSRTRRKL